MQRDPTLKIKKSELEQLLREYGVKDPQSFWNKAQNHQVRGRNLVTVPKGKEKDYQKQALDDNHVATFNGILKKSNKSFYVADNITKSSKKYKDLKQATEVALEFASSKGLTPEEGFKEFIAQADAIKPRFRINQLLDLAEAISQRYDDNQVLAQYTEESIEALIEIYGQLCQEYAGAEHLPKFKTSEQRARLVEAYQSAEEYGADFTDWLEAQFDQLSFTQAVPHLGQLQGERAYHRWEKFMAERHHTGDQNSQVTGATAEERDYMKKLKNN